MVWSTILPVLISALSMLFAGLLWLNGRSERSDKSRTAHIEQVLTHHFQPVIDRVTSLEARTDPTAREEAIKNILSRELSPIQKTLTQLEVKIDVYWTNFSMDAAKILHQPDPARHHIDVLLESFMDGTITDGERQELKKFLYIIRNWEPGQEVGFPIHPGEQVAAAILLRTMDYVIDTTRRARNVPETA